AADAGENPERIGVEHRLELSPQRRPESPPAVGPVRQAGELVASESIEPALRVVAVARCGGTPLGEVLVGVVEAEIEGLLRWHDALVAMPAEVRTVDVRSFEQEESADFAVCCYRFRTRPTQGESVDDPPLELVR